MLNKKAMAAGNGGPSTDPDFEYVTMLLHGDGTNGAQNNTFIDGSTNNFTVTRNGNVTQGSLNPFGDRWSNYFDGTDDYLSVADNVNLRLGSGAFTIEAWVFRNASGAAHTIFAKGGASTGVVFQVTSTNVLRFTDTTTNIDSTGTVAANTWVHVAVVREGTGTNQTKLYINGTQDGQGTVSTDFTQTEEVRIGTNRSLGDDFNGYISNLRMIKGTAQYTGNFTPSTAPLTAVTNTQLLTCQSNRFIDNSSNNFTITRNGDVSVRPFSPFSPSAAYSTSVNGGSGYFDGTGDYLSVADNANLRFGTSAFTIQAWVYRNAAGATHSIIAKGGASTGFVLQVTSTNVLRFTHGSTNVDTTTTIPASSWTHVAAVRTGTGANGFQLYINGVSSATATVSTDFNQTETLYVGADRSAANVMNGYISNVKYTNGTAETITVPTAPATATTNVALLLNFINGGIIDNAADNVLETAGNAQISTSVKKFGTGSLYFDGTGDWLSLPTSDLFGFGSGNFTIEFWLYPTSVTGTQVLIDFRTAASQLVPEIYLDGTSLVYYVNGAVRITATSAVSQNTWQHVALVKSGATTKFYVSGTNVGSSYTDTNTYLSTAPLKIGTYFGTDLVNYTGYIDDLRITKGVARYTANFTPPTAAFPDL